MKRREPVALPVFGNASVYWRAVRVLVTGGGGFIGSHLVRRLLLEGHGVRVLDSFATGRRENLLGLDDVELVEGDIQSYERAHTAVRGCEVVLHQAALPSVPRSVQDPLTSNAANVIGTLNVLLAARDCEARRVVYASSSSVYGASAALPKEEGARPEPISPYAVAKLAGEGYCRSFHEVYGMETVALRYFNVFGARQDPLSQYSAVVPRFISALLAGEPITIFGDGDQSRDFTYIDNVVDANLLAIDADGVGGGVFNVAGGGRVSVNQLLAEAERITGRSVEVQRVPSRAADVRHSWANIERARAALGYVPSVSFGEGLERTVESFRERWAERADAAAAPLGNTR
jgi:UDP-glucose 4-epimerase